MSSASAVASAASATRRPSAGSPSAGSAPRARSSASLTSGGRTRSSWGSRFSRHRSRHLVNTITGLDPTPPWMYLTDRARQQLICTRWVGPRWSLKLSDRSQPFAALLRFTVGCTVHVFVFCLIVGNRTCLGCLAPVPCIGATRLAAKCTRWLWLHAEI